MIDMGLLREKIGAERVGALEKRGSFLAGSFTG
jgi:hypothetical protein